MRLTNERILECIAKHEGEHLTTYMLAKELDYGINTVQARVQELEKQGLIERSFRITIKEDVK